MNIDREILFLRYCTGKVTTDERRQVEELINSSAEMSDELSDVREVLSLEKKIARIESYDIEKGYERVRKSIKKQRRRKQLLSLLSRAAAILVIPLLISTLIFGYMAFHKPMEEIAYTEVVSAPGVVSRLELPDKSKVWLNSNSRLRYPNRFEGSAVRRVELDGEGYFEVESDREHPFYVKTPSGFEVMAHGTKFNVNSEDKTVETILAEGKVSLYKSDRKLNDLSPGEQALYAYDTEQLNLSRVNLYEKLAWKDGKIIFRNAPLKEVFAQLSKRYNVDIVLHDEYNQSDKYLSRVTFEHETIQQIFSYLEIAAPIKWRVSSPIQNTDSTLTRQRIEVWLKKK